MHVRLNGDSKFAVGVNVRCLVLSLPCEIPATARLMTAAIGSSSPGNPELGKQFRKQMFTISCSSHWLQFDLRF